jgi:hypothetical protein
MYRNLEFRFENTVRKLPIRRYLADGMPMRCSFFVGHRGSEGQHFPGARISRRMKRMGANPRSFIRHAPGKSSARRCVRSAHARALTGASRPLNEVRQPRGNFRASAVDPNWIAKCNPLHEHPPQPIHRT